MLRLKVPFLSIDGCFCSYRCFLSSPTLFSPSSRNQTDKIHALRNEHLDDGAKANEFRSRELARALDRIKDWEIRFAEAGKAFEIERQRYENRQTGHSPLTSLFSFTSLALQLHYLVPIFVSSSVLLIFS